MINKEMDLRRQEKEEEERGCKASPSVSPAAPTQSPHVHTNPTKESTFSKPLLPLNSSLVQRGEMGDARNGGISTGYALAPSPFNPATHRHHAMAGLSGGTGLKSPGSVSSSSSSFMQSEVVIWQYRECQRNHAAGTGGHVVDGCCEFMPSDVDVTLKCAACGCHRSFHRKVGSFNNPSGSMPGYSANGSVVHRSPPQLLPPPPLPSPPPMPSASQPPRTTTDQSSSEEMIGGTPQQSTQSASPSSTKKRFRTKFTPEQKEKMFKFAESLSWRFQKPDDAAINEFCAESGVNRQVLKVWMHNNKYTYKKHEQYQPSPPPQPQMPPHQSQDH